MRWIIKKVYLIIIRIFNIIPIRQHQEVTLMMTFDDDIMPVLNKLLKEELKVNLIYHPKYSSLVKDYDIRKTSLALKNICYQLYLLKRSKYIVIDTYYLLLGAFAKKNRIIIQTWHAAGALKKFGLEEKNISNKSLDEIAQYKNVYHATDYYLVGSEKMAEIFKNSLDAKEYQMLKYGLPRLDKYFKLQTSEKASILYLPTFRPYESESLFDAETLSKQTNRNVIVKDHPSNNPQHQLSTSQLMLEAEYIITDYSSLAIEAALLNKKVIFYSYDEKKYHHEQGLNEYYYQMTEYNKCYFFEDIVTAVKNYKRTTIINDMWNEYNDGNATERLYMFIDEGMRK